MNFTLDNLPNRESKPRESGITMVMDKGLSIRQAEDFVNVSSEYVDVVKLGFSTSIFTPNLDQKLQVYREAGIPYYFGGTLFEAFLIRDQLDDFVRYVDKFKATHIEVSDGSIDIEMDEKLELIQKLSKNYTVLSEVGSKDSEKDIPPYQWVKMMRAEMEAGSWKVIAEARESGTVGVFQASGKAKSGLVDEITHHVPVANIIWEAPNKTQQVWFIKRFGTNVNLGNISPVELIPMETLRWGLRGDTFHTFLEQGEAVGTR